MSSSRFQPGQEVVLADGSTGVLYARTWVVRKWPQPDASPTWYFLPDVRGSVGLVVMGQPREVSEDAVAQAGAVREGIWPSAHHRLTAAERQAVYVAHMQRAALPRVSDS